MRDGQPSERDIQGAPAERQDALLRRRPQRHTDIGSRWCAGGDVGEHAGNTSGAVNSCIPPVCRVGVQVLHQNCADRAFGLRMRIGRRLHGQPRDVGAYGAVVFRFEDDWVEHCHSTPASRRMRLPNVRQPLMPERER
jgi:hypothetical protein